MEITSRALVKIFDSGGGVGGLTVNRMSIFVSVFLSDTPKFRRAKAPSVPLLTRALTSYRQ